MNLKPLLFIAFKINKSPHGMEKPAGDGKAQPQPSGKTAASGIRLVKIIAHLRNLVIRHANSRIIDIDKQISPVIFLAEINIDVNPAFLGKLNGIFQDNL